MSRVLADGVKDCQQVEESEFEKCLGLQLGWCNGPLFRNAGFELKSALNLIEALSDDSIPLRRRKMVRDLLPPYSQLNGSPVDLIVSALQKSNRQNFRLTAANFLLDNCHLDIEQQQQIRDMAAEEDNSEVRQLLTLVLDKPTPDCAAQDAISKPQH